MNNEKAVIKGILETSLSEKAGVLVGDYIQSLETENARLTNAMSPRERREMSAKQAKYRAHLINKISRHMMALSYCQPPDMESARQEIIALVNLSDAMDNLGYGDEDFEDFDSMRNLATEEW